jgi:hypothetical protein
MCNTDANWNAASTGQKLVNKGSTKVSTLQKKQQQMASQVFDLPEYADHIPMKKTKLDVNNMNASAKKNNHMYSDVFGKSNAHTEVRSPLKQV